MHLLSLPKLYIIYFRNYITQKINLLSLPKRYIIHFANYTTQEVHLRSLPKYNSIFTFIFRYYVCWTRRSFCKYFWSRTTSGLTQKLTSIILTFTYPTPVYNVTIWLPLLRADAYLLFLSVRLSDNSRCCPTKIRNNYII